MAFGIVLILILHIIKCFVQHIINLNADIPGTSEIFS